MHQLSFDQALKLQAKLDAITKPIPMDVAFKLQADFDRTGQLPDADAIDAALKASQS